MIHITACRTDNDDVSDFETVKAADPLPNHEVGCFHNFLPHVGKQAFVGAEIFGCSVGCVCSNSLAVCSSGIIFRIPPSAKDGRYWLVFQINKFPQKMRLADELE